MKNVFVFFVLLILFFSCRVRNTVVFSTDKRKYYKGDSVRVSWQIYNKKKFKYGVLNKNTLINSAFGDTVFYFKKDTVLKFLIYNKDSSIIYKKRKRVKILIPKIISFSVFRDRFNPDTIEFVWDTQNFTRLYIEGYDYNLNKKGSKKIKHIKEGNFTLVGITPFDTLYKSAFVGKLNDDNVFVVNDSSINDIPKNREINIKILETDISNYPNEIKLKVIAYDSLGNFITNLATPFASEDIENKIFKKVIDKSKKELSVSSFDVTEIHTKPAKYDIALTLDYSGSMFYNISFLEQATNEFIKYKYPDDKYSIIKYDNGIKQISELTPYPDTLIKHGKFDKGESFQEFGGGTALYASTGMAFESLKTGTNKKIVILFTDGYENSSIRYLGKYPVKSYEVARLLRKNNTKLIVVGIGQVNKPLLKELSYFTNGSYYQINYPERITDVYKEIFHNFGTYYEITIKPVKSEGEHNIQLVYYNNKIKKIAQRPYYIGDYPPKRLIKMELDSSQYWFNRKLYKKGYYPAFPPQSLVNFESDKKDIDKKYVKSLNNIINYLKKHPGDLVRIYGHTDSKADDDYNKKLSENRAKAVYNYFIRHGINRKNIKYQGMGETKLIYKNDKQEWQAKENRRVEIVIWEK